MDEVNYQPCPWLVGDGDGGAVPLSAVTGLFIINAKEKGTDEPRWALIASRDGSKDGSYLPLASFPRTDEGRALAQAAFDVLVITLAQSDSTSVYCWDPEREAWKVLGLDGTGLDDEPPPGTD